MQPLNNNSFLNQKNLDENETPVQRSESGNSRAEEDSRREHYVRFIMLEKGVSREVAEAEYDTLG